MNYETSTDPADQLLKRAGYQEHDITPPANHIAQYASSEIANLLEILHECWLANGNCFPSPDADFRFRQLYADDWTNGNESNADIFKRLLTTNQ